MNVLCGVPADWTAATVGRYCDVQLGKMLQNEPSSENDELKPYLRAINISKHGVNLAKHFEMWIRPSERERFRLRRGDILVSEGGDAGRTTTFDSDDEYYFQNAINRVRPGSCGRVVSEFVGYWFEYLKISGFVEMVCNVATIQHFTAEKVKAAPIAFPEPETQRRIAHFLDAKTARIDALIAKKRALSERLAEKRQALITQAVTKGLDPNVPMKDSGIDWLGQVPAHWSVVRVKWVAKLESGHTPDKKIDAYWEDCEIPWVSLNDTDALRGSDYISDTAFRVNELGLANSSARLLPPRAVVFTRDATIGESAITTRAMAVSQHIIAWLCNEDRLVPEFLLFAIYGMRGELLRLTNGSTIGTIGLGDVKALSVAVPPLAEQKRIVAYTFAEKGRIDGARDRISASVEHLSEYRSALITAAVTGQLEIPADGQRDHPDECLGTLAIEVA